MNPVAAPYFDFSTPEPTGVVGIVAPEAPSLLPLVTRVAAAIVSGNTAVAIGPETTPIPVLLFGEVAATSDLPAGVVNLLSGRKKELVPALATHRDVDAIDDGSGDSALSALVEAEAADRVRRVSRPKAAAPADWFLPSRTEGLAALEPFLEIKTTWHPAGV